MKRQTDVLVISGGILGCSLLYHLTRLGVGTSPAWPRSLALPTNSTLRTRLRDSIPWFR